MSNEELVTLAERTYRGLKSECDRMAARANHRKSTGRKLSAADVAYIGQLRAMTTEFLEATQSLLSDGKAHDLVARHRRREIELMDL